METLWLLIGIVIGRYMVNILDAFLELINHIVNLWVVKTQVKAKCEQVKFEKEHNKQDEPNRIGFEYPQYIDPEEFDDEEWEDDCKK